VNRRRGIAALTVLLICESGCGGAKSEPPATTPTAPPTAQPTAPPPASPTSGTAAVRDQILAYLSSLPSQSGNRVLSGQHAGDSQIEINPFSAKNGYANFVTALQASTGKLVALVGVGYDALDPTAAPLANLLNVNKVVRTHWNAGGLVEIGYAAHNPWTRGMCSDTATLGHVLSDAVTPGTAANAVWMRQLDDIAAALADLQSSGIVVLWRPFHEFNGNWFWWGAASDGSQYVQLWQQMHDYFTNTKKLDNLIWVWAGSRQQGTMPPLTRYYPGDAYVDVVGFDMYVDVFDQPAINAYNTLLGYGKPFALAEYGPTTNTTATTGTLDYATLMGQIRTLMPKTVYFRAWSDYIGPAGNRYWSLIGNRNTGALLADPWVVTADEVPRFGRLP